VDLGDEVRPGQVLAVIQPGRPGEAYRPSNVLSTMRGVVIYKGVEEGDIVTSGLSEYSGGTQILTVADLGTMMVKFQVNEVDIPKVHLGQVASITLDALPEKSYKGVLKVLSPMAQVQAGGSIRVFDARVRIDGNRGEIKPGMSARVEIITDEHKNVVTLPLESVFDEDGKQVVYRLKGKELKRVEVKTGLSDNRRIEVVSGLAKGERVSLQRPLDKAEASKDKTVSRDEWW
jgi:RND family efflux transporter MFP subunit